MELECVTSPEEILALGPGLLKVPELESKLNPPLLPPGPPVPVAVNEYVSPGAYPLEGKPVRLSVTVGDVEEWHAPAPQPSVELVLPELYAKAVSGTAIRISMNKVPMMIILDFVTLSPTISTPVSEDGYSQPSL